MTRRRREIEIAPALCLSGMLAFVAIGCAPASRPPKPAVVASPDHDDRAHHDHDHGHADHDHESHETLAGALGELEKTCANVKTALAGKDLDEADGHVHMVGHLIDDMHSLIGSAALPDEVKATAKKALDEVFECFDAMDTVLHSSNEDVRNAIDYVEHEPTIVAALAQLKKAVAATEKTADGVDAH